MKVSLTFCSSEAIGFVSNMNTNLNFKNFGFCGRKFEFHPSSQEAVAVRSVDGTHGDVAQIIQQKIISASYCAHE